MLEVDQIIDYRRKESYLLLTGTLFSTGTEGICFCIKERKQKINKQENGNQHSCWVRHWFRSFTYSISCDPANNHSLRKIQI